MNDVQHLNTMIRGDIEMLQDDIKKLVNYQKKITVKESDALKCSKCGAVDNTVIDSRSDGKTQIRRRQCQCCGCKWSTVEVRIEGTEKEGCFKGIIKREGQGPKIPEDYKP